MTVKAMLTGATGFVGGNLLHLLVNSGFQVRCLVRPGNEPLVPPLDSVEIFAGDLRDPDAVERCATGCAVIFHVAADYRLWVPDPENMFATNVNGTRNVLRTAAKTKVERIVYTSTVGTLGIPRDGTPGTEATLMSPESRFGPYKCSKLMAERAALYAARDGLDVVVVNPSTPIGPGDRKPTPTGQIVVDFIQGKMPAYVDTGLNVIHVKDVAEGHLLALKKGRSGERYILGNENLTLKAIFSYLADLTQQPPPKVRLPRRPVLWLAYANEMLSRWRILAEPRIPMEGVRMAARKMFFDASKAVRELGLSQTPVREALREAVHWFEENGYIRS